MTQIMKICIAFGILLFILLNLSFGYKSLDNAFVMDCAYVKFRHWSWSTEANIEDCQLKMIEGYKHP